MKKDIYKEIKRRILFFEYEPGSMLNEKAIATEFGVSRTPVREAFLRLDWEKLVTIMPRAGIMVTKAEFHQLSDVYMVRLPIEGMIARLAASQITADEINELESIKTRCIDLLETNDREALVQVDLDLRRVLSNAAHNKALQEISDFLYYQTHRLWSLIFDRTMFRIVVKKEVDEIEQTIEVLSQRDPDKAEKFRIQVIHRHMDMVKQSFGSPQGYSSGSNSL
jgi:DNA-binding GntR family transcriptional regulator